MFIISLIGIIGIICYGLNYQALEFFPNLIGIFYCTLGPYYKYCVLEIYALFLDLAAYFYDFTLS